MQKKDLKKYLEATGALQKELIDTANFVREKHVSKNVYFRGIIEFSNMCEKNCFYCGIRSGNLKVRRFRMDFSEIKECLEFVKTVRYGSVVLQSGELTSRRSKDFLLKIVSYIHERFPGMGVTLSCGELDYEFLKEVREAGAERYLLRIEASAPKLYKALHPEGHSLKARIGCLENLKKLNYQVGCGNMVGLPGQSLDDLCADLEFFKKMDFDMFGLGPYVIHNDTPLASAENKKWWEENKEMIFNRTLNFISLLRIEMPSCNIAAATALDVFRPDGRVMALKAGANIIMPVVTPKKYRKDYLLYQDKPCIDEDASLCAKCVVGKVRKAGLQPLLQEQGTALHYLNRQNG